jgi:HKD family nuclease
MRIKVCGKPKQVRDHLLKLLDECDSFAWASAWITPNPVMRAALQAKGKMARLVIGTHRYITSPDVLDDCLGLKNVQIYPPDAEALFHPKIYAFKMEDRLEVYIGSSNLTGAGLSRNTECGVFLSAEATHPKLQELLAYVDTCWQDGQDLTPDFVESYRANKARVKEAEAALKIFTPIKRRLYTGHSASQVDGCKMTWAEFTGLVRKFKEQKYKERLQMLSVTHKLAAKRFDELTLQERKKVTGRLRDVQADGIDYGWFGNMGAYGGFGPVIEHQASKIADALAHIPLAEEVTRHHFDAFRKKFLKVEGATNGWLGLATRLLAMRRPDRFVCIDGPNVRGVSAAFGAPYTTVKLDTYWDLIVAQVRISPWYMSEEPHDETEREIWQGRVALLDAIYYDPGFRK